MVTIKEQIQKIINRYHLNFNQLKLSSDTKLEDLGIDSLLLVELASQIGRAYQLDLLDFNLASWKTIADIESDIKNLQSVGH